MVRGTAMTMETLTIISRVSESMEMPPSLATRPQAPVETPGSSCWHPRPRPATNSGKELATRKGFDLVCSRCCKMIQYVLR